MEQLKSLKPDILWLDDITLIDRAWISYVRDNIPSLKIITGHICAPYSLENIKNFGKLDFLVTCTPCLKKEFEEQGIETYLLYHSFEKSILESIAQDNTFPENDLLFTGSLYTGGGFHKTRIEYVDEMLNAGLPLKIYGNVDSTLRVLSKIAAFYTINAIRKIGGGKLIKHIPFLHHYESYGDTPVRLYSNKMKATIVQPVFGLEQLKLLSKAGICFNLHGEIAKGCAGNLRLFEATGVGACLVTDWKANLPELFEPEKEVVTYKTKEECVDKIKWLLEHPSEMHKISEAGQARTLRDHTMQNRVSMMDGIFKSKI